MAAITLLSWKWFIHYVISNASRLIAAFIIFITAMFSWGCAPVKEYYPVYKDVYIPIRCDIVPPKRPQQAGNVIGNNLSILQYAETLEAALKACTGDTK